MKGPLIGESWEVSRLQEGASRVEEGGLSSLLSHEDLPYLVKYIDAQEVLSLQVHPGNAYAQRYEGSEGKEECWLILQAKEGAGVYFDFRSGVQREDFEQALARGASLENFLNFLPVERGDFLHVPPGTIHAIGAGVFLAEVQQSSGADVSSFRLGPSWQGRPPPQASP